MADPLGIPGLLRWERDRRNGWDVPRLRRRYWLAWLRVRRMSLTDIDRVLARSGVRLDPPVYFGRWEPVASGVLDG